MPGGSFTLRWVQQSRFTDPSATCKDKRHSSTGPAVSKTTHSIPNHKAWRTHWSETVHQTAAQGSIMLPITGRAWRCWSRAISAKLNRFVYLETPFQDRPCGKHPPLSHLRHKRSFLPPALPSAIAWLNTRGQRNGTPSARHFFWQAGVACARGKQGSKHTHTPPQQSRHEIRWSSVYVCVCACARNYCRESIK